MKNELTVICGGMYSGKSTELIRRYQRNKYAKRPALLFNHKLDTRYGVGVASTHTQTQEDAISIGTRDELLFELSKYPNIRNIYIDEFQFFPLEVAELVIDLVEEEGYTISVAGLDLTFDNTPFESIGKLYPHADSIVKVKAVCMECGNDAGKSFRLTESTDEVQVGSDGKYIALCRKCFREAR